MALAVNVNQKEPRVYVVSPIGSIDADTYQVLDKRVAGVLDLNPQLLIFNMEKVTYISSAGIGVIIKTKKLLMEKQGTSMMVNLPPQIKKVFDIIRALPREDIFSSMAELDNYLAAMQQKEREKD